MIILLEVTTNVMLPCDIVFEEKHLSMMNLEYSFTLINSEQ